MNNLILDTIIKKLFIFYDKIINKLTKVSIKSVFIKFVYGHNNEYNVHKEFMFFVECTVHIRLSQKCKYYHFY